MWGLTFETVAFAAVFFGIVALWAWRQSRKDERQSKVQDEVVAERQDKSWSERHECDE